MSNQDNQNQTGKKPTYIAYKISEGREQSYWNRIGAAWPHEDGKGLTLTLDSFPRDGRVSLRLPPEKQD